jgi:hypothetical protein
VTIASGASAANEAAGIAICSFGLKTFPDSCVQGEEVVHFQATPAIVHGLSVLYGETVETGMHLLVD